MKNLKFESFFSKGWFLTALLIIEELFLIVAATFFSKKINEIFLGVLVCIPFIITFIYYLMSIFEKSKSRSQTVYAGITGVIISFAAIASFSFLWIGLYILIIIGVVGIILAIHGFITNKKTSAYGILCINAIYFSFTFFAYGMLSTHARDGAKDAIYTILLLPILCAFIIADLISTAKRQIAKDFLESKDEM